MSECIYECMYAMLLPAPFFFVWGFCLSVPYIFMQTCVNVQYLCECKYVYKMCEPAFNVFESGRVSVPGSNLCSCVYMYVNIYVCTQVCSYVLKYVLTSYTYLTQHYIHTNISNIFIS